MNVAVVTGAAGGIGRAILERLTSHGWHVVAVDLDNAVQDLGGDNITTVVGDVGLAETHRQAAGRAHEMGTLTGWVNNAAVQIDHPAGELDEASLRRQIDVNLIGAMWGCSVAVCEMRNGGSIVSISSIHAMRGFPKAFVYAATKGGIVAMGRQLAVDYGPQGIRSNTVLPGAINTRMCSDDWAAAPDPAAAEAADKSMHLQGRMGEPAEIAAVVDFLLSDDSSLINGQEIVADGGATARYPRGA